MIGQTLKDLRINAKLTQKEVADIMNVTPQTISKWELGTSEPSIDMLLELSRLYQVKLDDMIKSNVSNGQKRVVNKTHIYMGMMVMYVMLLGIAITLNFVPYFIADIMVLETGMLDTWLPIERELTPITLDFQSWFFSIFSFAIPIILMTLHLVDNQLIGSIVVTVIAFAVLFGQQLSLLASPLFIEAEVGLVLHLAYSVILIAILILHISIQRWRIYQHMTNHPKTWVGFAGMMLSLMIFPFALYEVGNHYYYTVLEYLLWILMILVAAILLFKDIKKIQLPVLATSFILMFLLLFTSLVYMLNSGLYVPSFLLFAYMIFLAISMSEIKGEKIPLKKVFQFRVLPFELAIIGSALYIYLSTGDLFMNLTGPYEEIMIWNMPNHRVAAIGFVLFAVAVTLRFMKIHRLAILFYTGWFLSQAYYVIGIFRTYPPHAYRMTDGIFLYVPVTIGLLYILIFSIHRILLKFKSRNQDKSILEIQ